MLKTTQLPTRLAVPNSAFTSPQDCQETVLLLTWVYHARSGPSASWRPGDSQNRFSRDLEITRIRCFPFYRHQQPILVRETRTVNPGVRTLEGCGCKLHFVIRRGHARQKGG